MGVTGPSLSNWSEALYRQDGRCGSSFPAALSSVGQCNPAGAHSWEECGEGCTVSPGPCCSLQGTCGYSYEHCMCEGCIDYTIAGCHLHSPCPLLPTPIHICSSFLHVVIPIVVAVPQVLHCRASFVQPPLGRVHAALGRHMRLTGPFRGRHPAEPPLSLASRSHNRAPLAIGVGGGRVPESRGGTRAHCGGQLDPWRPK